MRDLVKKNEWFVQKKTFTIQINAWEISPDNWVWNVYANIFESHPLFSKVEEAIDLPFHGGCTLDELHTTEPASGIIFDWQKVRKTLKVGCDYNHYCDEYFNHYNPDDGIPIQIKKDVELLIAELEANNAS